MNGKKPEIDTYVFISENTPFKYLGQGACRGEGWSGHGWPKDMGRVTFQECADLCGGSKSCRAFDVSEKKGNNIKKIRICLL